MTFRHELKFLIHESDYIVFKSRIAAFLKKDVNVTSQGIYTVRSLYYDDYYNSAYNEKYLSILIRQKYRIRSYNHSVDVIHLERKLKYNHYVKKQTAPLSASSAYQLFHGDYEFLKNNTLDLYNVFFHEITTKQLRPRIMIDYEREPFIMDAGNVRITFDRNVRACTDSLNLFMPDLSMIETLKPGFLIMEVKYTEFLPQIIQKILPSKNIENSSISKYVLGCDRTLYKRKTNY